MKNTGKPEAIEGFKPMAIRQLNAERAFVDFVESKGFSRADAAKAVSTLLRLKIAKLDAVTGSWSVKHGAFLDVDVLRNAVNY
jgi:hypothetical protein